MKGIKKMVQSFSSVISDRYIRNSGFHNFNIKYYNLKGLKCGLLLALPIMLGLSLSVSLDTNALKHQVSRMPLYSMNIIAPYNNTYVGLSDMMVRPYFQIGFDNAHIPDFDLTQTNAPMYFLPDSAYETDCTFNSRRIHPGDWQLSGNYITPSTRLVYNRSNSIATASFCQRNTEFGTDGSYNMNWGSISWSNSEYVSLKPYSYSYASYTYKDQYKAPNGVVYDSVGFSLSDVLGWDNTHKITNPSFINIPIGVISDIQSSDFTNITSGTNLHFYYEIYLTDLSDYDLATSQNASVLLQYKGANANGSGANGSVVCNKDISYDDYGLRFKFDCDWTADRDYEGNYIGFNFYITPGTGYDSIWDVTFNTSGGSSSTGNIGGDVAFFTSGLYVVTDYDETPGGDIGGSASGSQPSPGSAEWWTDKQTGDDNANWFDSLVSLFSWNFVNPFAGLFNLFTDQNQCASIPTLASMLHSEETEVCPWFDSTTRNIVTPVLGIASVMLIFGFTVRWLSSSSGNMFEDQTTHKWGNTQFRQKGGN